MTTPTRKKIILDLDSYAKNWVPSTRKYLDSIRRILAQEEVRFEDALESELVSGFPSSYLYLESREEILDAARSLDFFSSQDVTSTRLPALFQIMIEAALQASNLLEKGIDQLQRGSAELGFSEFEQDPLGNPKQFRSNRIARTIWNPQLAKQLRNLAVHLVGIRRSAFKGLLYSPNKGKNTPNDSNQQPEKRVKGQPKGSHFYYLRQSRKAHKK
jgi:predicted small lipoprotein YifL